MKIHLASFGDDHLDAPVKAFARVLAGQRERRHEQADAAQADIILFTQCHMLAGDWRLSRIAEHPLYGAHPERVYVYDERDRPWLRFPGLYVSMPSRFFRSEWQVAAMYYGVEAPPPSGPPPDDDLLFSFVGSPSAACREPIYQLRHPRGYVERVTGFLFYDPTTADFEERQWNFADLMRRSKFVLCPRGQGTSSIRLSETLAAGRVPVIIADDWVPPEGPSWNEFTIRWPEARVAELPAYLEEREADVPELRRQGAAAFKRWLAPNRVLTTYLDQLERIVQSPAPRFPTRGYRDRAWLVAGSAHHMSRARHALSPAKQRARRVLSSRTVGRDRT